MLKLKGHCKQFDVAMYCHCMYSDYTKKDTQNKNEKEAETYMCIWLKIVLFEDTKNSYCCSTCTKIIALSITIEMTS